MQIAGSCNLNKRCPDITSASGVLKREQKKLEQMILEAFKRGDRNLGNNEDILEQSIKVDKLIVNAMLENGGTKSNGVTIK